MSVVLIYNQVDLPFAETIKAVALPSRKVITKDEDPSLVEYLAEYATRWKNDPELRHALADGSKDFYLKNFSDLGMEVVDENDEEMSVSAFYWMILRNFDSQSMSSAIYSDESAKELLREGGWFND
jgi:hypothetical protein